MKNDENSWDADQREERGKYDESKRIVEWRFHREERMLMKG